MFWRDGGGEDTDTSGSGCFCLYSAFITLCISVYVVENRVKDWDDLINCTRYMQDQNYMSKLEMYHFVYSILINLCVHLFVLLFV